jgi:hypothetical protein
MKTAARPHRLFDDAPPHTQGPSTNVAVLEKEVREWYATVSGMFPDTVAKNPRIQTISRGVDAYRSLMDMGFPLAAIKETLAWGLTQPFWTDRVVHLHNLVDMLAGEPITVYEAVARAHRLFKKGTHEEATPTDALPSYAVRALLFLEERVPAVTGRQRQAVVHFLVEQVPLDYKLLKARFESTNYGFSIMYPTVGAYVRAYVAYCGDVGTVTPYSFVGTLYTKFVDEYASCGGMRLLAKLRQKEKNHASIT